MHVRISLIDQAHWDGIMGWHHAYVYCMHHAYAHVHMHMYIYINIYNSHKYMIMMHMRLWTIQKIDNMPVLSCRPKPHFNLTYSCVCALAPSAWATVPFTGAGQDCFTKCNSNYNSMTLQLNNSANFVGADPPFSIIRWAIIGSGYFCWIWQSWPDLDKFKLYDLFSKTLSIGQLVYRSSRFHGTYKILGCMLFICPNI